MASTYITRAICEIQNKPTDRPYLLIVASSLATAMSSQIFDVDKQLAFYGAHHTRRLNVLIHMICIPIIVWTAQVLGTLAPVPSFVPGVQYILSYHLHFELNWPALITGLFFAYYLILEPVGALLYAPQLILSLLTATAYSRHIDGFLHVVILHCVSWIAQFCGHGFIEKRAPALTDNLLYGVVLAPFFVHLELLFAFGYNPEMHKRINNEIGKEISKIRKAEGDKKRGAQATLVS